MRKILLLLLLPVFSLSYGQGRATLDSLLNRLSNEYSNKEDTSKVGLLYKIALQCKRIRNDSVTAYGRMAVELADKLGGIFFEGMYLFRIGELGYKGSMGYVMRALTLFEQLDDKPHIAMVLDFIAGSYYNLEEYPQALVYFEQIGRAHV